MSKSIIKWHYDFYTNEVRGAGDIGIRGYDFDYYPFLEKCRNMNVQDIEEFGTSVVIKYNDRAVAFDFPKGFQEARERMRESISEPKVVNDITFIPRSCTSPNSCCMIDEDGLKHLVTWDRWVDYNFLELAKSLAKSKNGGHGDVFFGRWNEDNSIFEFIVDDVSLSLLYNRTPIVLENFQLSRTSIFYGGEVWIAFNELSQVVISPRLDRFLWNSSDGPSGVVSFQQIVSGPIFNGRINIDNQEIELSKGDFDKLGEDGVLRLRASRKIKMYQAVKQRLSLL